MAEPVKARRLTDEEGQTLQRIVRRGKHDSIRVRRALIIMASASGTTVSAIAQLVKAHQDTVRDMIHAFNQKGLNALDPRWAGGRPRQISSDGERFIVATATTRPEKLGRPFTHWSVRKLADYLAGSPVRVVKVGRERLRQLLRHHKISFQRTRTWKESTDPQREAKLDRIEQVTSSYPDRCFAFDQFGPLSIRPCHGSSWAKQHKPDRLPATYRRTHGIRYFHGCYSLGDDQLWGITRRRKGADHTLVALKSIRAAPTRRRADLRGLGQPVGQQDPGHPSVGEHQQGGVVLHADQRLLGQSDRGAVRAAAQLRAGQLRSPQPHRAGPQAAGLSALAQRQRPPPRGAGRPTPRASPRPQRPPAPLGPPQAASSMIKPGERMWSAG
jgi:transposase